VTFVCSDAASTKAAIDFAQRSPLPVHLVNVARTSAPSNATDSACERRQDTPAARSPARFARSSPARAKHLPHRPSDDSSAAAYPTPTRHASTPPLTTSTRAGQTRHFIPTDPPITGDPSGLLPLHEASRLRAAAHHAKRAYPGAIGELVARELTAHAEFGYRFAADGLLTRLATEVLGTPVPR